MLKKISVVLSKLCIFSNLFVIVASEAPLWETEATTVFAEPPVTETSIYTAPPRTSRRFSKKTTRRNGSVSPDAPVKLTTSVSQMTTTDRYSTTIRPDELSYTTPIAIVSSPLMQDLEDSRDTDKEKDDETATEPSNTFMRRITPDVYSATTAKIRPVSRNIRPEDTATVLPFTQSDVTPRVPNQFLTLTPRWSRSTPAVTSTPPPRRNSPAITGFVTPSTNRFWPTVPTR